MIDYSEKDNGADLNGENKSAAEDSASNVLIHVMPEQFRDGGAGQGAKSTGLAILIGGVVLLGIGGAAIYYFMFRAPALPLAPTKKAVDTATTTKADTNNVVKTVQPVVATTAPAVASSSMLTVSTTTVATTSVSATPTANSGDVITLSTDTDRDGLTDDEEITLGSNKDSQDSDSDGFGDLVELQRGYDPAGPGKLISNKTIKTVELVDFTMLRPATWTEKKSGGDYLLLWQAPDNQLIQVSIEKLTAPTTLAAWYKTNFGTEIPSGRLLLPSQATNWTGVKSSDNLNVYVMNNDGTAVYTINYNLGMDTVSKYPNIFEAMINSFSLK